MDDAVATSAHVVPHPTDHPDGAQFREPNVCPGHAFEHLVHELEPASSSWHHEHASVGMLDHLIAQNGLESHFRHHGLTAEHGQWVAGPLKDRIAVPRGHHGGGWRHARPVARSDGRAVSPTPPPPPRHHTLLYAARTSVTTRHRMFRSGRCVMTHHMCCDAARDHALLPHSWRRRSPPEPRAHAPLGNPDPNPELVPTHLDP